MQQLRAQVRSWVKKKDEKEMCITNIVKNRVARFQKNMFYRSYSRTRQST